MRPGRVFVPGARGRLAWPDERSDLGYPFWPGGDPVVQAFEDRMERRFGWRPEPGVTRVFSDLIQVLQVVIEAATAPRDGVAIAVPSYPPFLASIQRAGRRIVPIEAVDDCAAGRSTPTRSPTACGRPGRASSSS